MTMPKFRAFACAGVAVVALAATAATADPLADEFQSPPNSARPRVWWHWMNGNVTIDGIEKDLDWMSRIGIGGVQNFDASLATPQIVAKRLVYMDPDWKAAFRRAVEIADQKGMEFAIAASPGWSETGGPWVKPEDGMKKLVWSETLIAGGKRFAGPLKPLPTATGPFQSAKLWDPIASFTGSAVATPPEASGPVGVYAVPVGAAPLPRPTYSLSNGGTLDSAAISDGNPETAHAMTLGSGQPASLVLDYGKPVTARSANLYLLHAKPPFGDPATSPVIEAETASGWRKIADLPVSEVGATAGFAPVTFRERRVRALAKAPRARSVSTFLRCHARRRSSSVKSRFRAMRASTRAKSNRGSAQCPTITRLRAPARRVSRAARST
jgi:alpha-L-rhamnosidase